MSNAETNRAVPFLAAFNAIERFLRDALGAKKSDSFSWLARLAARQGVLTLQQSEALSTPLPSGAVPRLAIITEHGKSTQKPISVLGATDIPALTQAM